MTNANAAISATSAGHVYLTLAEGTTNSLSDSSSNSDEKKLMQLSFLRWIDHQRERNSQCRWQEEQRYQG